MDHAASLLEIARGYVAAGLSVIPVLTAGTKAPAERDWTRYNRRRPTDPDLGRWFAGRDYGIGIPGGPASGNLAVLDFETAAAFDRWQAATPADTADAFSDCPRVRTPSGGVHVWVRLPVPVAGTVLARRPDPDNPARGKTLIEVRGDGQQVLAPGCPPACHPSGKTYEFESRGWLDGGPSETPIAVWYDWLETAAALNEWTRPAAPRPAPAPRDREPTDDDPGTDFNRRGTWEETGLTDAGWAWARQFDFDRGYVRRPGKADGTSGTLGLVTSAKNGWPLFHCFSTNGDPFLEGESLSRFAVYARLKHGGDFKAAARALLGNGYGRELYTPKARLKAIEDELRKKAAAVAELAERDDPEAQVDSELVGAMEDELVPFLNRVESLAGVGNG